MRPVITRKWRPPLWLVLGGALGAMLALPAAGLLTLRALQDNLGFRHSALIVVAGAGLVTLVLGILLWRLLLRPVTALADSARAVQQGAPADRVHLGAFGTAELSQLGRVMLGMAATLQSREAAIRSFADHAAHGLKTPLTAIKGAAEMLSEAKLAPSDARLLDTIQISVARMEDELTALRRIAFAREPRHHGQCRLATVLPALRDANPGLDIIADDATLPLSAEGLTIVMGHLAENARLAGAATLTCQLQPGPVLIVRDDGPGISDGNKARIFEPFFTTNRDKGGTGMGLAIVRAVMEAHSHEIDLIATQGGAQFRLSFAG
jgi:two-component system, OmpR family, sensor kinase